MVVGAVIHEQVSGVFRPKNSEFLQLGGLSEPNRPVLTRPVSDIAKEFAKNRNSVFAPALQRIDDLRTAKDTSGFNAHLAGASVTVPLHHAIAPLAAR